LVKPKVAKRKIYYRKCEFLSEQKRTFQQLVSDALKRTSIVKDRSETIGAQAIEFRVIGRHKTESGFLCGQFVTFERGSYQTVIGDDPQAKELAVSAMSPPKINSIQHQFVPGVLFFAIYQNHVVVIQSAAVRTSIFEQHIGWLLRDKTGVLANDEGFVLKDEPQPATKSRIRKAHVKSVALGRPLMNETTLESHVPGDIAVKNKASKFQPDSAFLNLFKEFFKDSNQFEKLGLENATFDSNLEVWIEIRYPHRQRSRTEDSIRLLDNLGIALRDIDEDQARLKLNDGTVIRGKDLKISGEIEFSVNDKGLPSEDEVFIEMIAWLGDQIRNGVIAPD